MGALRNPRRERFVREYLKLGAGGPAYAKAYERRRVDNTAYVNASRMLRCANVQARLIEVQAAMLKRSDITLEKLLTDLEQAKEMANRLEKPNDISNAVMAQAKLVGLLRDRIEAGNVGDFDGTTQTPAEILEQIANDIGPQAALELAKAFGLTEQKQTELEQTKPISDAVN